LAGIFVIMQLIIFGIEQLNSGFHVMKPENLLLKRNELVPFFGIAGNRKAGDRKLKTPLRFNGGGNDGVVSKDLLGLVRIGRLAPHANAGISIIGQSGTTESKSIGSFPDQV